MFRKITLIAVPAVAIAVTLFANVDSSSLAFAKGGSGDRGGHGGHGRVDHHRDYRFGRYGFGCYGGYCWNYPSYGFVSQPCCACETVVPAVQTAAVVETPVVTAEVCPTCGPGYGFGGGYYRDWRFRRDNHRERPLNSGRMGSSGHGKK